VLSASKQETVCFDDIVSRNPHVLTAARLAHQAALLGHHVLIVGEQGTEKELFAAAIHNASSRAQNSLIELDCFYLPSTLLEQILFGRQVEKELQPMMKNCADGTLFIQEVGSLPLVAQSRIVRAIQLSTLLLDGGEAVDFTCKLIGSSTDDMLPALTQTVLWLPPLRHRKEDIPLLVHKTIDEFAAAFHRSLNSISDEAMNALIHYPWPGNVRELNTIVGRCALLAKGEMILTDHLPKAIQRARKSKYAAHGTDVPPPEDVLSLATVEKRHIQKVLDITGWHKVRSAQILGIDRSTLYDKIRRYNLVNRGESMMNEECGMKSIGNHQ